MGTVSALFAIIALMPFGLASSAPAQNPAVLCSGEAAVTGNYEMPGTDGGYEVDIYDPNCRGCGTSCRYYRGYEGHSIRETGSIQ